MSDSTRQGDLPDGWVWTTLGDVTQPVSKIEPKDQPDEPFIYLDISSIDNLTNTITEPKIYHGKDAPSRARQLVQTDDVLFSTVRTYLKNIALVQDQYDGQIASTGFCVLRGKPGISGKYLFYYSLTHDFLEGLGKLQRGVSYPAVREQDVRIQPIPLAPSTEQQRIVAAIEAHFTRLDAAVAALQRVQANLRRYRAAVLKAACEGRLVPTEAALARRAVRTFEPADVLLARILAGRRSRWEAEHPGKRYVEPARPRADELPALPEGWVWATVKQVGRVQLGRQRAPQYHEGLFMRPYLRVANVFEDRIDTSSVMWMNFDPEEYEKYKLQYGDILLNEGQSPELLGRPAMYRNEVPGACFQNTLIRFQAESQVLPQFALCLFRTYMRSGRFQKISQITTNIAHLSAGRFADLEFPLPPLAEQQRIVAEVERRLSVVAEVEATVATNLQRAARLRQAVLKQAFAGRLVPQDPGDEPASVLLDRIRTIRGVGA